MPDTPTTTTSAATTKPAAASAPATSAAIQTRTADGRIIYSAGGKDLLSRDGAKTPHAYTVLIDVPAYDYHVGDVKVLSQPHEESLKDTLGAIVKALGL